MLSYHTKYAECVGIQSRTIPYHPLIIPLCHAGLTDVIVPVNEGQSQRGRVKAVLLVLQAVLKCCRKKYKDGSKNEDRTKETMKEGCRRRMLFKTATKQLRTYGR